MTDTTDYQWHARELAAAIQRFRNEPLLEYSGNLRATAGYAAICDAWEDYKNSGGPVLPMMEGELIFHSASSENEYLKRMRKILDAASAEVDKMEQAFVERRKANSLGKGAKHD